MAAVQKWATVVTTPFTAWATPFQACSQLHPEAHPLHTLFFKAKLPLLEELDGNCYFFLPQPMAPRFFLHNYFGLE